MRAPVPILLYHSIDAACSASYRRWMMLPQEFRRHMEVLQEEGYRPISVSDFVSRRQSGTQLDPSSVIITFDDGLRDFLTGAMPILSDFGFTATLYVVSGSMGATSGWLRPLGEGTRGMLDWNELRDISRAGIEIGAHTVSHPELDVLSRSRMRSEIADSKKSLEDALQRTIRSFAYPHGYARRLTRELVAEAGFESACRVRHALSSTDENVYALSRLIITSEIAAEDLRALLSTPSLPIAPPVSSPLSACWRMYRQIRFSARQLRGMASQRERHAT